MQEEEQKRQKQNLHQKSLARIKKQIAAEEIDGKMIAYSFLDKKNNSGISTNLRIFFLYQKDCIGYINQLSKGVQLPFKSKQVLPKLKNSILLEEIEKVTEEKQLLKINFKSKDKKGQWIFKCQPITLAKLWAKMINSSIQQMKDDKLNPPREIVVEPPVKIENQNEKKPTDRPQSHKKEGDNFGNSRPSGVQGEKGNKFAGQSNNQGSNEVNSQAPVFGQGALGLNNILKPKSSLFVGGMSVQNQKDQIELKNRMQSIENVTSKMKQEYERKKQQERLQEQSINPMAIAENILSFSTNVKYQIEKMEREWGYEFAKSQNEYEIVEKFKYYVQAVSGKIIDELGLEEKKRYYQPQDISNYWLRYEISGVLFQVYLTQLREINSHVYSFAEKGTVVSNQQAKLSSHEFKNYDYFLRLTANKGRIRVPLSMMTQHKGMTVYAKVMIPTAQTYDNMQFLEKQLQIIQTESRISNSIFQDPQPETGKILALQSKVYQKLARAENISKKFNICFIEGLKYYLPHDFNNFNKQKPNERLRWQLIQDDECQQRVLYGQDMCAVSGRLKMPQNLRDGINQLTEVSKFVLQRLYILIQQLESVEEWFTNSEELSEVLHKLGINMRYLGVILEKSKANWLKEIIMSEICARCAKKFLNFDLQDCLLNINQTNLENVHKFQVTQVIKFLNKMLGNGQETEIFWKQLNRQSQSQYHVSVNRQQINQPYLLQALQHHCCIRLKNINTANTIPDIGNGGKSNYLGHIISSEIGPRIELFSTLSPFSVHHFASFEYKSKVYNLQFTELYMTIKSILSEPTQESFEQLKLLLNLARVQNVATHFRMSNMYERIVSFLTNWLTPEQGVNIYNPQEIELGEILPSKLLYTLKLAEIKWGLKSGKIDEAERTKQWIIEHINKWIGDCHPILTELYEIYAHYYMSFKDQEKKAVNYCKSAIKNEEKLIGPNHHKMADSYYLIGQVYRNYGKKSQSINSLKKAKEIILKSSDEQSEPYGAVCLKMGQLLLSLNFVKEALESGGEAMAILEKYENLDIFIQSIELTCRCFEVLEDWESYLSLIESSLVHKIILFIDNIELTERAIKACILPNFKLIAQTNTSISQRILKIISELPETTRAPNMAYNFLRARIQEKVFPHRFLESLVDIEEILDDIENNGMLTRWKGFENLSNKSLLNKVGTNLESNGFNFIANLEALNIFIGRSYIECILLQA